MHIYAADLYLYRVATKKKQQQNNNNIIINLKSNWPFYTLLTAKRLRAKNKKNIFFNKIFNMLIRVTYNQLTDL